MKSFRVACAVLGLSVLTMVGCSGSGSSSAAPTTPPPTTPPTPAPSFGLSVSPASQTVVDGGAAAQVSLMATPANGFTGTVAVAVSGLPAGVTLTPSTISLAAGTPQSISLQASATAAVGAASVVFTGTSGTLSETTTLALTVSAAAPKPPTGGPDVTTYHYDNTRQGQNTQETALTLANVNSNSFGLKGVYTLDGKVDGQPLYVGGLQVGSGSTTNVIYAVTEHDSVFALNAATGATVWKKSVLGSGEQPSDDHGCDQVSPQIGITSTPVIDRGYGTDGAIFVVGMSKDAKGNYHQRLHALDLVTGAEIAGSPTEISANFAGSGPYAVDGLNVFDPGQYVARAGLLLMNGTVYVSWSSHCDQPPYTGWVMGYSETTLQQSQRINLTPNGTEGSIWMSGYGLAGDTGGNIFFLDANGTLDTGFTAAGFPSQADFGNAIIKLSTANGLSVADYWEPYDTAAESDQDVDLGSGGAMLLPDVTDNAGKTRHLLVGAGKDANIYVADRDNMGKFLPTGNTNLYQQVAGALPNGAWSGPAYFHGTVYYGGVGDNLKAFSVTNARLSTSPTSVSGTTFGYPGATPAVSANGTKDGIVWALESTTGSPAVLHAYDATDLSKELYNSNQAAKNRDAFGDGNKFLTPVITNGMVFVGTPSGVAVFGLLNAK